MDKIVIRLANDSYLPSLGRLGALLLEKHYLKEKDVVVFVAERAGAIVGYVYAGLEPTSWKELRDMAGFIHDVVVEDSSRRLGIASSLVETATDWLRAHGAPRVMLWTAEQNPAAQNLFSQLGFRRTMIEMTREL
jgi:GNAT superfamily N-acetyltransferase